MPDATLWAINWHRKWGRRHFLQAAAYRELGWNDLAAYYQRVSSHHYAAALERLSLITE